MEFDERTFSNFESIRELEWIETNGIGGYASDTVSGAHSRKYHGLLVAALQPPLGRHVMLSKLDETIQLQPANDYEKKDPISIALGTNQYPGVVHPDGFTRIDKFERDLFPTHYYRVGDIQIKKTIAAIYGENTTVVLYEVLQAPTPFTLSLMPLSSYRDFHSLSHANDGMGRQYLFEEGIFRTLNYQGGAELFISVPGADFTENQAWYYNFEYAVEQRRGLDFQEDLYTHGTFSRTLKNGDTLGVIVSVENPEGRIAEEMFAAEKTRREEMSAGHGWNKNMRRLVLAADQFIVKRGKHSTILAGYHWFADWGRDTMISLPGLCLATGRYEDARQILRQFAETVSEGMLPNRFPEDGEAPEYNTMDATLWFFQAVHQYYIATKDKSFLKSLFHTLEGIIEWHDKGTRYNIKVDEQDGLLSGGQAGVQLTWMDAKVGDWVVTPRIGKPVEINALWYNALCTMEVLSVEMGKDAEAAHYQRKARRVLTNFNAKFWNKDQGCLYDYIDGEYKNNDIRPNQLYALSLSFPLLVKGRAKKVFDTVTQHLFTSKGLRSLSPTNKDYRREYRGDLWQRDGSYHQGTVWSFLLGPYIDSLMLVKGEKGRAEAARIVNTFLDHLNEAGVGTVSEIFDAELPNAPRGCIAQAWGVAELLRVISRYKLLPDSLG